MLSLLAARLRRRPGRAEAVAGAARRAGHHPAGRATRRRRARCPGPGTCSAATRRRPRPCTRRRSRCSATGRPATRTWPACRTRRMVIQEAMRLYPPVWGLTRKSVRRRRDRRLPGPGRRRHHDLPVHAAPASRVLAEPDEFRPERFATSAAVAAHRYAYIPFGAGPRVCVGSHLGMMEATLVAAMVARDFRFEHRRGRPSGTRSHAVAAGARRAPDAGCAARDRRGGSAVLRGGPSPPGTSRTTLRTASRRARDGDARR